MLVNNTYLLIDFVNNFLSIVVYSSMMYSHKVYNEESLILLEYHAVLDGLLLVKIIPGSIRTLFTIASIFQYPVTVLVFDCCLHL